MNDPAIRLIEVTKRFGSRIITNALSLDIPRGKLTVILGKSGEGKSVLLKQIVGLVRSSSGTILVDSINVTALSNKQLLNYYGSCGYVFQFAALLDSLTIFENIGITLLEQGIHTKTVMPLVKEKMQLVHLPIEILHRYPSEISGGMQKRVGLARTLMTNPRIILYDEPTSGLDPITSCAIHMLMREMQQALGITSVVVSHDLEILNYADYVVLLYQGAVRYSGSVHEVRNSDNPYINQFLRGSVDGPMQT